MPLPIIISLTPEIWSASRNGTSPVRNPHNRAIGPAELEAAGDIWVGREREAATVNGVVVIEAANQRQVGEIGRTVLLPLLQVMRVRPPVRHGATRHFADAT